jgi:hypothetical protein
MMLTGFHRRVIKVDILDILHRLERLILGSNRNDSIADARLGFTSLEEHQTDDVYVEAGEDLVGCFGAEDLKVVTVGLVSETRLHGARFGVYRTTGSILGVGFWIAIGLDSEFGKAQTEVLLLVTFDSPNPKRLTRDLGIDAGLWNGAYRLTCR